MLNPKGLPQVDWRMREVAQKRKAARNCRASHRAVALPVMKVTKNDIDRSRNFMRLALAVAKFFVPGHLDGFELGFVGGGRVAGKAGELGDPFVHVGEADGEGIGVRIFVSEGDGDVFEIVPTECRGHVHSRKRFTTKATEIAEKDGGINSPLEKASDRAPWRSFCSTREFPRRCRWCRRERSGSRGVTSA